MMRSFLPNSIAPSKQLDLTQARKKGESHKAYHKRQAYNKARIRMWLKGRLIVRSGV